MRTEVERRPALIACLGLIVGICAGISLVNAIFLIPLMFLRGLAPKLLAAATFAVGALLAPGSAKKPVIEPAYIDSTMTVVKIPSMTSQGWKAEVRTGGADYNLYSASAGLSLGDELHVRGVVKPLPEGAFAGRTGEIVGSIEPVSLTLVRRGNPLPRLGIAWRENFIRFCDSTLDPEAATAVGALCFNAGSRLDRATRDHLQRTGTTHIISVSGLHVMVFAVGVSGLLSLFPVPRAIQIGVLLLALALYALATGLQPPVVRAGVMAGLYAVAYIVRREPDLLSALAFAALCYLLWQPSYVLDVGFQLSFVTVAAMSLYVRPVKSGSKAGAKLLSTLKSLALASLVATVASAPLVAYHFGIVSMISVPANLLIAAALAPVTLTALAGLGLSFVYPPIAIGMMRVVVQPLVGWILFVVHTLGDLSFAAIRVPAFNAYWLPVVYGAALLVWRKHVRQP